jgi:hypothetical protein
MPVNKEICFLWLWFIFVFLSGFRYRVGGDTLGYIDYFNSVPVLKDLTYNYLINNEYQPFWILLCSLSKTFLNDFTLFQVIHAIIVNTLIFIFLKRNCSSVFAGILFYFIFYYFYFNMEILRESIAIGIFLVSIPFLQNKKWVKYYFLSIIAFMFHVSAIITLFIPFILIKKNLKYIFIGILAFIFLLFNYSQEITKFLIMYLPSNNIKELIQTYSQAKININGIAYTTVSSIIIPMILIIQGNKINFKSDWISFIYIYIIINIGYIFITPFYRLANYLFPIYVLYVLELIHFIFNNELIKRKSILITYIFLFLFIPHFYSTFKDTSKLVPNSRYYNIWYPYYSVFNKKVDLNRELLIPKYTNPNNH